MSTIATVENAIIDCAKSALGVAVREVKTLPGGWTLDMLKRALQMAPGVYVAFVGGPAASNGGYIDAGFAVYAVAKGAAEEDRRRGNPREIGAYEIIERLAPALDRLAVPNVGELVVREVQNAFTEAMFDLGGTVYALALTLPNMPWPDKDISGLAPFVTFEGTHSMAPGPDEPAHQTQVTLPQ